MSAIIGRTILRAVRRRTRLRNVANVAFGALLAVACATAHESAKPAATAAVDPSAEPQSAAKDEATSTATDVAPTGSEPNASAPGPEAAGVAAPELDAADVSEPDSLSELATAAFTGDERKVAALLARGADVNRRERKGATALTLALGTYQDEPACCKGAARRRLEQMALRTQRKLRIARTLIEHGADVRSSDSLDLTPLHYAVMVNGREPDVVALIELLIAHGADVNRRTQPYGRSPLEESIQESRERVACLLRHGADPSIVTHEGKTLLEVAEARGDAGIVEQLKLALGERARK